MTAEYAAGGVAEVDRGVVAGHRRLAGHRVAAGVQDNVHYTMPGWVVGGETG